MRPYGIVSPMFWTGTTGKKLRTNADAQRVALYLMTGPHSHQSGIYYLPLMYLSHEVGISQEGASKALTSLTQEKFCEYDPISEWVWVCGMAGWQIGLGLLPTDKRCKGVQQYLQTLPRLPFLSRFAERYKSDFHLSPIEGASEGLSSNRTGTEQEQEPASVARAAPSPKSPRKKPKTALPEGFALDGELKAYAEKHLPQVDVALHFESFCGKARAKSWAYADWRQAWQEYCRNCAPNSGHWAAGQYPKNGGGNGQWM